MLSYFEARSNDWNPAHFARVASVTTTARLGYQVVRGRAIGGRDFNSTSETRYVHTVVIAGDGWDFKLVFSDTKKRINRKRLLRSMETRLAIWRAMTDHAIEMEAMEDAALPLAS